jgi:hypothetical protein
MRVGIEPESGPRARETARGWREPTDQGLDLSLLEESLAKTPWERMQANDDALRFAEALRAAMEKRRAEPE